MLEQSFTAQMPLLSATTSAFRLGRRRQSSPHWCYTASMSRWYTLQMLWIMMLSSRTRQGVTSLPGVGQCVDDEVTRYSERFHWLMTARASSHKNSAPITPQYRESTTTLLTQIHPETSTGTATVLRPLDRKTCVSRQPQLRTGGFCWNKVSLTHSD